MVRYDPELYPYLVIALQVLQILMYQDRKILSYCHKYPFCLEWLHFERCSAQPDPGKSAGWFNGYKLSARCDKVSGMSRASVKSPCSMKCLTFPTRQVTFPWLAVSSPWTALIPCKGFGANPPSLLLCLVSLRGTQWILKDQAVALRSKQGKRGLSCLYTHWWACGFCISACLLWFDLRWCKYCCWPTETLGGLRQKMKCSDTRFIFLFKLGALEIYLLKNLVRNICRRLDGSSS